MAYKEVFDGLASGDWQTAEALAQVIGGRAEIEAKYDDDFSRSFGYTLKYAVLAQYDEMEHWRQRFHAIITAEEVEYLQGYESCFQGYSTVFSGLPSLDLDLVSNGIRTIAEGHKQLASSDWFGETEDELLSIWGIGLANLARHRGLTVEAIEPFIPADLLI